MNNLKKILFLTLLFSSALFYGQRDVDKDKIKTLKIAFITEKLNLSSQEAQGFWPIYNDYQAEKEKLRQKEYAEIRSKINDADKLSEKEAATLLNKVMLHEDDENKILENFMGKVTKVISAKKTLLLLRSEEEFKRQLIRQYHEKNRKSKP
ncbi:hypothetical protein [Cellulophaga sp. Hel_I_12]|uniref:hypothetical protein n=1 Tax=Cellulophaga sp. Hel_I_12 TaxID=1249972 RepID=UPI000646E831|nr:hypothetical protein [Cellulophaga sp. Hel_I_12]